jgi:hypothetical protein
MYIRDNLVFSSEMIYKDYDRKGLAAKRKISGRKSQET